MRKIDVCKMCDNYSAREKCDHRKECTLMKVIDENETLKKQVKELKKELADIKLKMSYTINPSAVGERNDMGW